MFCLAHSITTSTWGSIARPVDTTGGTWTVTLSGTQSTTVLPQEIHAKDWDTVTHYKLIPVGIPQYSCTVIVFNLTGNDCSAILVCYCLGTDKEPVQLDHLIKKTRTFTSPVSLTQKKKKNLGGITQSAQVTSICFCFEQPKYPNLKKKKSTSNKTKALFPSQKCLTAILLNYQVRSVQAPEAINASRPSSQAPALERQSTLTRKTRKPTETERL